MKEEFVTVRRARVGDERGIHEAHMKSVQTLCSKDYSREQIKAWGQREFRGDLRRQAIVSDCVWVAEKGGIIEGYAHLFVDKERDCAEIRGLYLTPAVTSQGHGKTLVEAMKEKAQAMGVSRIELSSTVTSKRFYEGQGFFQFGEDNCCLINGVSIEGHSMRYEL